MAVAGVLEIQLLANMARLQADMNAAKSAVGGAMADIEKYVSLAKTALIGLVGIGSVAAFKGMISSGIEAIANLQKLSTMTGVAVEQLSGLGAVARLSGTSLDTVGAAMNKLSKNMAIATEDGKGAASAIKALGINFDTFQAMSPDQRMQAVSKAMAGFADGSGKTAAAMLLYGKAGAELLPMLKDLADVQVLQAKVTNEQGMQAKEYEQNLKRIKASSEAWKKELVMGMLPALNQISEAVLGVVNGNTGLRDSVRTLSKDGSLSEWTRSAVVGFSYLIDIIQGLASIFPMLGKAIGGMLAYTTTVFGAIGEAVIRFIKGDYSGAFDSLKTGAMGVKTVFTEVASDIGEIWNQKLIGASFRENLEVAKSKVREITDAKPQVDLAAANAETKTAIDAQIKAYADWVAKIKEKIAANLKEAETGKVLTEAQKEQLNIAYLATKGTVSATDASSENTKQLLLSIDASEKAKTLALETVKANLAQAEAHGKYVQSLADGVTKLDEQVRQQREATAEIGLTKDAIGELRAAEIDRQAAVMEGFAIRQFEHNLGEAEYNLALANVKALRELATAKREFGTRETAYAKEQEQIKEQLRLINSIDSTAQSVWTNVFEGGSNAFKKLGQTLKAAVLDMLYQMTLKKWIISVTGSVTGASASAMEQAAGAGSGGLLSGASNAYSMYGAATGFSSGVNTAAGFLGAGTTAGASGASLAYANGVGALGGDGIGALIASNASWGGVAAASSTALVASNTALATTIGISTAEAAAGATAAAAAGVGGTAAATGVLAAIGPVGWAAIAAVAAFAIFSGKKGIASQSTGSMERTYDESGNITASKSPFSAGNGASVVDGLYNAFATMQKTLGATGGGSFSYGGYSGNDNKNPMMRVGGGGFNSGEIANTEENSKLAASRAVLGALMTSNLPRELAGVFNGLDPAGMSQKNIDDVYAYAQALKALDVNLLASPFTNLKNLSYEAAQGLIKASGGLEKLIPNLASYYDNFYSAEEKRVRVINDITNTLNAAGANVTTAQIGTMSRDAFRAMVDAAGSNMQLNAALLSVNGAFASITPAATAAAASITAISDTMKGLLKDRAALQADVMQARGDTGGADAVRRALTVATYTEAETAAYDHNQALRQEAKTLQDATAALATKQAADIAAAQAAQAADLAAVQAKQAAAQALAAINKGLSDQLDVLKGKETDRSIALRDATDGTTRELLKQIYAQQDLKAATQDAALAATQAAAAQKAAAVAAMQAATTAVTNAFNQVNAAANDQKSTLSGTFQALTTDINAQLSTVGASIGKLQSLSSSLKSALDGMQISGGQNTARTDAQSTIAAMLETAKSGGGLPVNTQALNSALSTISKPSEQLFGSFVDYARDFYKTSNNISALNDLTTKGLTSEQVVEATLKAQLAIEKASYDSQIAQITATQAQAKAQLDAFTGNGTTLTTLANAVATFSTALSAAVALSASQIVGAIVVLPPEIGKYVSAVAVLSKADRDSIINQASQAAAKNGTSTELELYNKAKSINYSAADVDKALSLAVGATAGYISRAGLTPLGASAPAAPTAAPAYVSAVAVLSASDRASVLGNAIQKAAANGTAYELELYNFAKSIGYKAQDVDQALGLAAGATQGYISTTGLPQLAIGTNYVPRDMIAQIHEGEAVVPKAFNPAAGGKGDDEGLKNEMRAMRSDLNAGLLKIAQNTGKTAKLNDRWESDGLPATRTTT